MARFEEYANSYRFVKLERRDGILQMTFHTDGGPLQWPGGPHAELVRTFLDVGSDPENKVIIMTGTGDAWSGPRAPADTPMRSRPRDWDHTYWEGKHLLTNLLNIEVPIIAAINGPALRHAEIPLLSDIVLATPDTVFQDSAHVLAGNVPGDGMHIVFPLLLGWNRGRYVLLTGQTVTAQQAHEWGLVAELLPRDQLVARAWALAEQLAQKPALLLRYTRVALTQRLKRELLDLLGYGLALEELVVADNWAERAAP